jgi:hypothetical protein
MKIWPLILAVLLPSFCDLADPEKFIVKVGHYNLGSLSSIVFRCFGTAISPRHALTAASCAFLEPQGFPTLGLAIEVEELNASGKFDTFLD